MVIGAIVAVVVALVLNLAIQFGYGLVIGFQLRGTPPQEMLIEPFISTPFLVVGVIVTTIAALMGGRMAARRAQENLQLTDLATGILAALLVLALRAWQWGLDLWALPTVVVAVLGGWLGGWLISRGRGKHRI